LHFIGISSDPANAVRLWMASYGVVYGLLGAMLWIGVRARWTTLADANLRWGVQRASVLTFGAAMFFVAAAWYSDLRGNVVFIVAVLTVMSLRLLVPKIANRVIATRAKQG
jgi:hypothetical protein